MLRHFIITLSGASLLAGAAAAAAPAIGANLGTDPDGIAAALSAEKYAVTRLERLPDAISVTAVAEDRRLELALDSGTGAVIGVAEYGRSGAPLLDDAAANAMLAGQGYAVTGLKQKGDEIEVKATRDGRRWELELDPRSGEIREIEAEEDES